MKNNYPDSLTIQQYLNGQLDPDSMHQLEKQALEDPFLADALEGYSYVEDSSEHLSLLQRQLHERIVHLQENKKVFDLTWQRLSVAAAAAVLFISSGILFWMNNIKTQPELASNPKQTEVNLTSPDSLFVSEEPVLKPAELAEVPAKPQAELIAQNKKHTANSAATEGNKMGALDEVTVVGYGAQSKSQNLTSSVTVIPAITDDFDSSRQKNEALSRKAARSMADASISARMSSSDSNAVLNEVVVGPARPAPKGGWESYNKYLRTEVKRPFNAPLLNGIVILSAEVRKNGDLTNIEIVQGLHPQYDKEAIRLVKNGPKWNTLPEGNNEVRIAVTF